jgi:hypothetical protein
MSTCRALADEAVAGGFLDERGSIGTGRGEQQLISL